VRDGFHFWAFLLGPLWLVWHRLWLALLGYVAIMAGVEIVLSQLRTGAGTRFIAMFLIALLMGFEAASLQRWTRSRRKWRQLDIVVADDTETAERRLFDRWASVRRGWNSTLAVDRGAPPPTRGVPGQPFAKPASQHDDIIGLFPQPGAPR
jgi:Protein of unknown function (DUF2628)